MLQGVSKSITISSLADSRKVLCKIVPLLPRLDNWLPTSLVFTVDFLGFKSGPSKESGYSDEYRILFLAASFFVNYYELAFGRFSWAFGEIGFLFSDGVCSLL